jgi:flavodoxin/ferredoxin
MPRGLIVYFSQGGTTASVAEHIAAGLCTAGYTVDLCNIKDENPPELDSYHLLGVGAPVYYYRPPFNVTDYVSNLPDLGGRSTFVFVLHGTYRGDAGTLIRNALIRKGAHDTGFFHCYGEDHFLGYLKEGYLFSPGHPTPEELDQAKVFGRTLASTSAEPSCIDLDLDPPPPVIYRLERFLVNRWLVKTIHTRLFAADADVCTGCGLCTALCPMENITEGANGVPVWGHNCLLCFTCHMKCPEDAITSPVSWARWPLFRLFMSYNVRQGAKDPSIECVRVVHRNGHTTLCTPGDGCRV